MSGNKENTIVRITLTPEQSDKIKAEIGRSAEAIVLTVQELEARITPYFRLAGNHNETLLTDDAA